MSILEDQERNSILQVTFSGVPIPPLPLLSTIPYGMSIVNSPDADFTGPARLPLLTAIGNGLSIAGCNSKAFLSSTSELYTRTAALLLHNTLTPANGAPAAPRFWPNAANMVALSLQI